MVMWEKSKSKTFQQISFHVFYSFKISLNTNIDHPLSFQQLKHSTHAFKIN